MKKSLVLLMLLFLTVFAGYSQPGRGQGGGGMNPADMPKVGIIRGLVQDENDNKPVPYANIAVYRVKDSVLVNGGITDMKGNFEIKELTYGRYYVIANFIGYNKKTINDVKITPNATEIDMGVIKIAQASTNIEGVEVTAEKVHVEYKIDRKVVNVSQDIIAAGGTAVQALENIPSVNVDIEGNVSLRGSSSFAVLIDGRPSVLSGTDALAQIPASAIENIEIITNPSAKYDPDGRAGIINIVTKKSKLEGFAAIINASVGTKGKYSTDLSLSYRQKKYNLFFSANLSDRTMPGGGSDSLITTYNDTSKYEVNTMERNMHRGGWDVKLGSDIFLDKTSTLTVEGSMGDSRFLREHSSESHKFSPLLDYDIYSLSTTGSGHSGGNYRFSTNYQKKFKKNEQVLEAYFSFSTDEDKETETQDEYYADNYYNSLDTPLYLTKVDQSEKSKDYRIKADYSGKIGPKSKLSAGFQSRLENNVEDYNFNSYDTLNKIWVNDAKYSSAMDYNENIHAVYSMFTGEKFGLEYQLGLRGELTDRSIVTSDSTYAINRFDYFPTVHFSKQINKKNQLMASYARRVQRPGGWELSPFISFMNSTNIRSGNPGLEPEFIDSYELSYQNRQDIVTLSLEGYYRKNTNKITRIRTVQSDGLILNTNQNLSSDNSLGLELMANVTAAKWLQFTLSGNYFKYWILGDIIESGATKESNNFNVKLNTNMRLTKTTRFQFNGSYDGPSVTAQGSSEGMFFLNAGLRQEFLKGKLSASLQGRNLFNLMKHEMITQTTNLYSSSTFFREANQVTLSISYKINNYKKEKRGDGEGDRMESEGGEF